MMTMEFIDDVAAVISFAVESTRLEGRSPGVEASEELAKVAAGTRSADDAVASLLAAHSRTE